MYKFIEKLYEKRNSEPPVKNDYTVLFKALFGEIYDSGINDNAEIEKEVNRILSVFESCSRYCLEERYLHGKPLERLTEEFRSALDMNEFTNNYIERATESLHDCFMDEVTDIFLGMQSNNFNELKYLDKQRGFSPKPDGYYEKGAFQSAADILRISIEDYEKDGRRFEDAYTEDEFDELCDLFKQNMDGVFYGIMDNNFYELNYHNSEPDFIPEPEAHCEQSAFRSNIYTLRDCLGEFYCIDFGFREIFEKYFMKGETKEQLAEWISDNLEEFVNEFCIKAIRRFRRSAISRRLREIIRKEPPPRLNPVEKPGGKNVVPTGFVPLDKALGGGFRGGSLNIIAARPGMGKTSFAVMCAAETAKLSEKNIRFFSLENSSEYLKEKYAFPGANSRIIIDDPQDKTVSGIRQKISEISDIGAVFIDYFQLISADENASEISEELKLIAQDFNIPVICVLQLGRQPENRNDHRPMLTDISKAVIKNADVILSLYSDSYYDDTADNSAAELHVLAGLSGLEKVLKFHWSRNTLEFDE